MQSSMSKMKGLPIRWIFLGICFMYQVQAYTVKTSEI